MSADEGRAKGTACARKRRSFATDTSDAWKTSYAHMISDANLPLANLTLAFVCVSKINKFTYPDRFLIIKRHTLCFPYVFCKSVGFIFSVVLRNRFFRNRNVFSIKNSQIGIKKNCQRNSELFCADSATNPARAQNVLFIFLASSGATHAFRAVIPPSPSTSSLSIIDKTENHAVFTPRAFCEHDHPFPFCMCTRCTHFILLFLATSAA